MSKSNGSVNVSQSFLDKLDQDAHDSHEVFTPEMRKKLIEILREYAPEAKKYVMGMSREERDTNFINWVLTMRVVEFKAEQASGCLVDAFQLLKRTPSKGIQESITKMLMELDTWLKSM